MAFKTKWTGEKVRTLRERTGLGTEKFSRLVKCSRQTILDLEKDGRPNLGDAIAAGLDRVDEMTREA